MIKNQQDCPIVDENERALRFEYRFRRYGIIVLSLIILTALSGLWSSGYFSEAHRESAKGELSVDYQRYARLMSETEVNIQIKPDGGSEKIISFTAPFLSRYQVGDIRPQPDKMYSAEGNYTRVSASGQPLADVRVVIHYPKNSRQYFPAGGSERSRACHLEPVVYP
ncbi:Uncharacterised protein [Klebsiella variicola]|uniref:Uncharacterized protein n=1 Tax=Klebsiella variicola TaxID=244366 RepID=A0A7H4MKR6_KLEVA|nr:Uncharacterised protein [Klebsiella variicola]